MPPAAASFQLAYAPRRKPIRGPLLLSEALDAETLKPVHVSAAVPGGQYVCPFANCLERVRLRAGQNRRRHFAHLPHSACINPASLHDRAIQWVKEERAILLNCSELVDGGLSEPEIFGGVVRTEAEFGASWRGKRRQRRADAQIVSGPRVLAIEFVRTHELDQPKRNDYCEFAAQLQQEEKRLLLLEVRLAPDVQNFRTWTEEDWRSYVLFDGPRRCLPVPPPPRANSRLRS